MPYDHTYIHSQHLEDATFGQMLAHNVSLFYNYAKDVSYIFFKILKYIFIHPFLSIYATPIGQSIIKMFVRLTVATL